MFVDLTVEAVGEILTAAGEAIFFAHREGQLEDVAVCIALLADGAVEGDRTVDGDSAIGLDTEYVAFGTLAEQRTVDSTDDAVVVGAACAWCLADGLCAVAADEDQTFFAAAFLAFGDRGAGREGD